MESKPGYKSTEFWVMIVVQIILLLYGAGVIAPESTLDKGLSAALHIAAALGYQVQRTALKKAVQSRPADPPQ